jgi:hypothetical protein
MNIICQTSPTNCKMTMTGWSNALASLGHKFTFWDSRFNPIFDIFDENEPDIFISTVNDVSSGMVACLKASPEISVLFYSPTLSSLTLDNIDYVRQLKEETGKPDFIFNFASDDKLGGWNNYGIKTLSIPRAMDSIAFQCSQKHKQEKDSGWKTQIAIVGDYQPFMDPYVLPLCQSKYLQVRIFGTGPWPVAQYVGEVEYENLQNIFKNSQVVWEICPEGDLEVSWLPFNVFGVKGLCLTNNRSAAEILDIPAYAFPANVSDIEKTLNGDFQFYGDYISINKKILENHTYVHRMKTLLGELDELV